MSEVERLGQMGLEVELLEPEVDVPDFSVRQYGGLRQERLAGGLI